MSDDTRGCPDWMVTFSDIMSLLVTFFVLMLTWSTLEVERFELAVGSLQGALGSFGLTSDMPSVIRRDLQRNRRSDVQGMLVPCDDESTEARLGKIAVALRKFFGEEVQADMLRQGYRIRIAAGTLFAPGSADLSPACREALDQIAGALRPLRNPVRIDGHTDDRFAPSPAFPTAWHLSAARASATARYLAKKGPIRPERLSVAGYAGRRPAYPNRSDALRRRNRRIEVTILTLPKKAEPAKK